MPLPTSPARGESTSRPAPGVLVVDDDPQVLELLRLALQASGLRVWTAQDGRSGVRLFEQHRAEIRVALLDVCMPDLDGLQTSRRLKAIDPEVVSCFMTGHLGEYTFADLEVLGPRRCFSKPFQLSEVVRTLQELVSEPFPYNW